MTADGPETHARAGDGTPDSRAALMGERPSARGKFLYAGGAKFFVKGVTYGTFRPGPDGVDYPAKSVVEDDFVSMKAAGFNAIRTYTMPPAWVLDSAMAQGLRVLAGLPWEQHIAFLHERGRAQAIARRVRDAVAACAGHPALLGYAVGNEIPAAVVRWSGRRRIERHIRRLHDAVKSVDDGGLVTYVNFPSTEYLELPFLDFVAFNVYLESQERLAAYLARLQNLATAKPLVMAELGLDSRRNGTREQAFAVQSQVRTAFEVGCAGAFVFSWTDEWHRGGHDVHDWTFGLTTADRRPKPALSAVSRVMRDAPFVGRIWPRVSVVVCVYNAETTLADCLEGLSRLEYRDYEVIVVDDGSTDDTAVIADGYDVRLIRQPNRGLSAARNAGLAAATGEIVAYIDGDAWPDPQWLHYLAMTFADGEFAGVGGPNLAPAGDGFTAACVSASPGGPIHVLLSDREAEHLPGCNMAFRRSALEAISGFDSRFRVAGDDVDVCWRLIENGGKLGFSPAAVVWHHQRDSVRAFWRQQRGYGRAEALLEAKWPEKYNAAGHVTWGGRVYGAPVSRPLRWTQRVYHGTWGQAPFQPLHAVAPGPLASMAATPEWYLVLLLLAGLSALGLVWPPMLAALPLLVAGAVIKGVGAMRAVAAARYPEPARGTVERAARHILTFALHLMQPAARLWGRLRMGLYPWRLRSGRRFRWPGSRTLRLWSETWRGAHDWLASLESKLVERHAITLRATEFDAWDLEVRGGHAGLVRVAACVEEHGEGRQLLRLRLMTRTSATGLALVSLFTMLGVWAAFDSAWKAVTLLIGAAGLIAVRAIQECGVATDTVATAIDELADDHALTRVGRGHPAEAQSGADDGTVQKAPILQADPAERVHAFPLDREVVGAEIR